MITKFNEYINESIRDKMIPKSDYVIDKKIEKSFKKLSNMLIKDGYTKDIKEALDFWYNYYDEIVEALIEGYDEKDIYDSYDEGIISRFGYLDEDDDDYYDEYDTYNQPF